MKSTWFGLSVICLNFIWILLFFGADDPLFIMGGVCAFLLSVLFFAEKKINIMLPDIAVLFFAFIEVIGYFTSINKISGFDYVRNTFILTCIYFILRLVMIDKKLLRFYLKLFTWVIFFLCLISLISFRTFSNAVFEGGFEYLSDVKFLFRPLGILLNVWGNYVICFTGISLLCLLYNRENKVTLILCLVTLSLLVYCSFLTFSRGVYIGMGILFFLMAIYVCVIRLKLITKVAFFTFSFLFILLPVSRHQEDIKKTLKMTETVSQNRSIQGRVNMAGCAKEIFLNNIFTGVGGGNFSLAANEYLYEDEDHTFTGFSGSIITQIVTEKGLLGIISIGLFAFSLLPILVKGRKFLADNYIIYAVMSASLIREVTFPCLLEFPALSFSMIFFFVILTNYGSEKKYLFQAELRKKNQSLLSACLLLIFFIIFVASYSKQQEREQNDLFLREVYNENMQESLIYLERTSNHITSLLNKSYTYLKLYTLNRDDESILKAKKYMLEAKRKNSYDPMIEYNLSVIYYIENQKDSACHILNKLIEKYPGNALYNLSFFKMNQPDGELARNNLEKAILSNPNLLATHFWAAVQDKDSVFSQQVIETLRQEITDNKTNDPIWLAKKGRISFLLGERIEARKNYEEALVQLPNLSRPWFYLGIIACEENQCEQGQKYIRKAQLLEPSLKKKYPFSEGETVYSEPMQHEADLLLQTYAVKYKKWYKENMVNNFFSFL